MAQAERSTTEEDQNTVKLSTSFLRNDFVSNSDELSSSSLQGNAVIEKNLPLAMNEGQGKTNSCDIPPVDAEAVKVLETKAKELESNLNRMMHNLKKNMNGICSSSVQHAECYRECVKNIGNLTDTSTKAMANLIAKCEEMNRSMEPLYSMGEQLKMLKLLLDQFEERCK